MALRNTRKSKETSVFSFTILQTVELSWPRERECVCVWVQVGAFLTQTASWVSLFKPTEDSSPNSSRVQQWGRKLSCLWWLRSLPCVNQVPEGLNSIRGLKVWITEMTVTHLFVASLSVQQVELRSWHFKPTSTENYVCIKKPVLLPRDTSDCHPEFIKTVVTYITSAWFYLDFSIYNIQYTFSHITNQRPTILTTKQNKTGRQTKQKHKQTETTDI